MPIPMEYTLMTSHDGGRTFNFKAISSNFDKLTHPTPDTLFSKAWGSTATHYYVCNEDREIITVYRVNGAQDKWRGSQFKYHTIQDYVVKEQV